MKKTAKAPANIAFIKYWGKTDPATRVPNNNSISMNLSEMYTETTVEFDPSHKTDDILFLDEEIVKDEEKRRIVSGLDAIRSYTKKQLYARVVTRNTFPKATGIASSASGFASLATAAFAALDALPNEKELSIFCRKLSGTACRSIPDGFVEWEKGTGSDTSYAHQLHPSDYWDICDVVAVVTKTMKKISSTDGHALAQTSPLYNARMAGMDEKIRGIKKAMSEKNFPVFGRILEDEALSMHAICITSTPPVLYWEPPTIAAMRSIQQWRQEGKLESYFTIDAGPSVHVLCKASDAKKAVGLLRAIPGTQRVEVNTPSRGAHLIDHHLF